MYIEITGENIFVAHVVEIVIKTHGYGKITLLSKINQLNHKTSMKIKWISIQMLEHISKFKCFVIVQAHYQNIHLVIPQASYVRSISFVCNTCRQNC